MKRIVAMFLLSIAQSVSAQSDSIETVDENELETQHWSVRRGTDVMFSDVTLNAPFPVEVDVNIEVEVEKNFKDKLRDSGLNHDEINEEWSSIEWMKGVNWTLSPMFQIFCRDTIGFPITRIVFVVSPMLEEGGIIQFEEGSIIHRIGMNVAEENRWLFSVSEGNYGYLTYFQSHEEANGNIDRIADSSAFVDTLVRDNSRFVFRGTVEDYGVVTFIWNVEGLAEVIDECLAVFD